VDIWLLYNFEVGYCVLQYQGNVDQVSWVTDT